MLTIGLAQQEIHSSIFLINFNNKANSLEVMRSPSSLIAI